MQKVALITGGNKGIGLEVTRYFLLRHYRVIVIARDFKNFEFAGHSELQQVVFDLQNIAKIPELIADLGDIDVLVNNAGVMFSLPFTDYPQDKISLLLKINIEAPVALIQAVAPSMIRRKSGRIVNNASIAGQIGHPDIWYGISKAALINATKSFAKLLGADGIIVNAVAPSPVATDMLATIPIARRAAFLKNTIANRFAEAQEIAQAIGWLGTASPEYMNGTCLDLNNGAFPR